MIDTIVLRIHNLKKKYDAYGKSLKVLSQDDKEVIKYNTSEMFKGNVQAYQYYADTDKVRFLSVRNTVYLPSSHYNIGYSLNYERDYLEINLSIPKFYFGTNVFQFTDKRELESYHVWKKLERFIYELFNTLFSTPPDYIDVEVNRIDVCYNQIFLSKDDALAYLKNQKQLQIAFARSDNNKFNEYGSTTIQAINANYSFKIYHKGTEFRKNDLKELAKYNPKAYDLKELQSVADRMLRYEITIRKSGMMYVFRQKVKDDVNTMFNHNLDRIHKTRTKAGRKFIEHDINNKTFSFHLSSIWDEMAPTPVDLMRDTKLTFNYELFISLVDFFFDRVKRYQFDKRLTIEDVNNRIKKHAEIELARTGKSFDVSNMLITAVLSQYIDLRDLKGILPKATYYRYLNKLKEADIPVNNEIDVYTPTLDNSEYFNLLGKYHTLYN